MVDLSIAPFQQQNIQLNELQTLRSQKNFTTATTGYSTRPNNNEKADYFIFFTFKNFFPIFILLNLLFKISMHFGIIGY